MAGFVSRSKEDQINLCHELMKAKNLARIAVLTVSDTRQLDEDKSGQTLVDRLNALGTHWLIVRS